MISVHVHRPETSRQNEIKMSTIDHMETPSYMH